nr:BPI fold-containing family B member 3-like [Anolis sagrei ordinatus]
MWKVLGVLVFCGLLSPTLGIPPGIRAAVNDVKLSQVLIDTWTKNGLLENNLKNIGFSDIHLGGLLSLVDKVVGLKIDEVALTSYTLVFLNEKAEVSWSLHLGTISNIILPLSNAVTISFDVHVKFVVGVTNFSDGQFDFIIHSCGITLGAIDVKLLGGVLSSSQISTVKQSLTADLQRQLCPIAQHVCDEVKLKWLDSVNVVLPLGASGNLKCQLAVLPTITPAYVGIDLAFQYEESGVSVSTPDTHVPIAVPSLDKHSFCLAISPAVINILLHVATPKAPLEVSNNPAVSDLIHRITIEENPAIAFSTDGATVTLVAHVEILGKEPDGSKASLVILRCNLSLKAIIALVNEKVTLSLSLSENVITVASSRVNIIDTTGYSGPINRLVNEILLPAFNGPLSLGLPLPPILDISLVDVSIETVVNALVFCL